MGYKVVVVGATGNVGREMLTILAEREFPIDEIAAVASPRSQGTEIDFGDTGKTLKCKNRSEEHTSELQSLMRISYAVFCLKKKTHNILVLTMYYTNCKS